MTTMKATKRALLSSVVALFLCFAMLLGTTYAWFTDTVKSANNIITSGNLDVKLEYWDGSKYAEVTSTTKLFNDAALWEPGHTEVAYLKVSNVGSLALKYQLNVNVVKEILGKTMTGEDLRLSDHLVFNVVDKEIETEADLYTREGAIAAAGNVKGLKSYNSKTQELPKKGDADYVALIIYMPTNVQNEANHDGTHIPSIEMGVNVIATQMSYENDGLKTPDYDENAWADAMLVYTEADLQAALANGGKVTLSDNITVSQPVIIPEGVTAELDLNGFDLTTSDPTSSYAINNLGTLTLKDSKDSAVTTFAAARTVTARGIYNGYGNGGDNVTTAKLIVENGKFNAMGTNGGAAIFNYGIVEIKGGTFTSNGGYALNNQAGATMSVDNATVTGGIYNMGDLTIDNSTVYQHLSDKHAIYNWAAKLVVNGGSFDSISGNELILADGEGTSVVLNDGTFNKTGKSWLFGAATGKNISFTINGGTYNGYVNLPENTVDGIRPYGDPIVIKGGSFNFNPATWVATDANVVAMDNGNGTWDVIPELKDGAGNEISLTLVAGYPGLYTDGNDMYVYTAQGLISLNNYFAANTMNNAMWNKNYNIMADINATGYEWNNVYMVTGSDAEEGLNLLGNGHTISNLTINGGGLLGGTPNCVNSQNPAFVKDLTFDNATVTGNAHFAGVIWGGAATCGDIYFENVHIKNSNISGKCNVGAFVGGTGEQSASYDLTLTFKNCSVENTKFVANGTAGPDPTGANAFVGRAYANTFLVFEGNNTETNNTFTNNNGLVGGGIYGYTIYASNGWAGTGKCDTFANWDGITLVKSTNELEAALNAGKTDIMLDAGTYGIPSAVAGKTVTFTGVGNDTKFDFTKVQTVSGASITFKNLYIEGVNSNTLNGYGIQSTTGHIAYEGCTLNNAITNENYGTVSYTDCTFTGMYYITTYSVKSATFTNCVFNKADSRAVLVYSHGDNPVQVTLTNCKFYADAKATTWVGDWTSAIEVETTNIPTAGTTVTINNCTADAQYNGIVRDKSTKNFNAVITVDGTRAVSSQQLASVVAENATLYLMPGNYDLNGIQKSGMTLIGLGNVQMANTTKFASGKAIGAIWQKITLENMTITDTVYTMADGGQSTFNNVTFAAGFRQGYGTGVTFNYCTFGSNSEGYALHFQTDSASEGGKIILNGCTFEGGKVHLGGKRSYEFTNCEFATGTDFQVWSNITLTNCTVNDVVVTAANMATLFPNLDATKVTLV